MKTNVFGILFVVLCVVGTFAAMRMSDDKRPVSKPAAIDSAMAGERGGPPARPIPERGTITGLLITLIVFGVADMGFVFWAKRSIDSICRNPMASNAQKLQSMENEEVLFDLPLYLGLGGTVLGFLMIADGLSISRDVAYVSTILGIISSALMRVFLLRPRRAELIEGTDEGRG